MDQDLQCPKCERIFFHGVGERALCLHCGFEASVSKFWDVEEASRGIPQAQPEQGVEEPSPATPFRISGSEHDTQPFRPEPEAEEEVPTRPKKLRPEGKVFEPSHTTSEPANLPTPPISQGVNQSSSEPLGGFSSQPKESVPKASFSDNPEAIGVLATPEETEEQNQRKRKGLHLLLFVGAVALALFAGLIASKLMTGSGQASAPSNARVLSPDRIWTPDGASQMFEALFAAGDNAERMKYLDGVNDPAQVQAYFEGIGPEAVRAELVESTYVGEGTTSSPDLSVAAFKVKTNRHEKATGASVVIENGAYRLYWPAFYEYQTQVFNDFYQNQDQEEASFHVLTKRVHRFGILDEVPKNYEPISIKVPGSIEIVALADQDTATGLQVVGVSQWANLMPCHLTIRKAKLSDFLEVKSDSTDEIVWVITQMKSHGWRNGTLLD